MGPPRGDPPAEALPPVDSPPSACGCGRAAMAFREVRVFEVREVLRLWLRGEGLRSVERLAGVDRKTVRRYITAAEELGLRRDGGEEQLTDLFIGQVVEAVRPHRRDGHGEAWRLLEGEHDRIEGWLKTDGLTVRKTG